MFFSFVIASFGSKRKIGYSGSLLLSLIFSPLIGAIVVALSPNETDELNKIKISYDAGVIDKDEFQKQVRTIIPTKEDKDEDSENMRNGCLITLVIVIALYLMYLFIGWMVV